MYKGINIKPPFFEIGPKAYLYGEEMLALAKVIDKTAIKYDVDIIVTPQAVDIRLLAENTERILVFAQHMDYLRPARGLKCSGRYLAAVCKPKRSS
jgi:triosephosphate isomerase